MDNWNNRPNRKPLTMRKQIQLLTILTILAWATQTLLHQWGFGQEIGSTGSLPVASERFVPADGNPIGGIIELRSEARIATDDVKLRQICRWSDRDAAAFRPIADLVIARVGTSDPYRSIDVKAIKAILHDAGVNLAFIDFTGSTACMVSRSDVPVDEQAALQQWIDAKQAVAAAATQPADGEVTVAAEHIAPIPAAAPKSLHSLRDLLVGDLAERMGIEADRLQLSFAPQDEKVLNLVEPYFKFSVVPRRARSLGDVSWDVTINSDGASQKVSLSGVARAWEDQIIASKPMAYRQIIKEDDVADHRTLVDRLNDLALLTRPQCVNQQAARDLKPGAVLTSAMVDPLQLVHTGQLVTVTLTNGSVQLRMAARAMENGSLGQTVHVRNETTRDIYDVTVTGHQTAAMNATGAGDMATTAN